jgi:hypothetical protein
MSVDVNAVSSSDDKTYGLSMQGLLEDMCNPMDRFGGE